LASLGGETIRTGIEGLDEILCGGLPAGNVYLVRGVPGTGKTTLALRFLLAGVEAKEPVVYVALGETPSELATVARSHGWSLDGIEVCDLHGTEHDVRSAEYTFFHPAEVELTETARLLLDCIDRVSPTRVVIDSLSEMRMLARDALRYRRQVLALRYQLARRGCTVLMLDTTSQASPDFHIETVAHGVLTLDQHDPAYGRKRRRLAFEKVRGVAFRDGWHDYVIARGGLQVFPRPVATPRAEEEPSATELAVSGNAELDTLLGGGVERGSSTLLIGPSGSGKSTLAMQFLQGSCMRGESAAVYLFDESRAAWLRRADLLGMRLAADGDLLRVRAFNPSELSPGELGADLRRQIEQHGARSVVIDSLNGYREAMAEECFVERHLHQLLSFASERGVNVYLTLATFGTSGAAIAPIDVSYLADSIIALRYFEAFGEVRKALSVLKKRMGPHESTIRELDIRSGAGIRIGPRIHELRGLLTNTPEYTGDQADLARNDERREH
jgi:circadian clock protein KaiC